MDNNTIPLHTPSGNIIISIKLPDGTSLKANFSPEDTTLQQVRHHIDTHRQDSGQPEGAYRLVCGSFPPKRVLDDDDNDNNSKGSSTLTLAELCIGDRSTLIVEPVEWTKPRGEKGGGWLGGWLGYLGGGWGGKSWTMIIGMVIGMVVERRRRRRVMIRMNIGMVIAQCLVEMMNRWIENVMRI
jgi:hypothetical protein